jgi:hypothetical protein
MSNTSGVRGAMWGSSRAHVCLSLLLGYGIGRGKHAKGTLEIPRQT